MISSKSKSGLSESSQNKASPATPRVSKLGRGVAKTDPDSPSPLPKSRLSIDRSPRSVDSKPAIDRRSPKTTTPDKQPRVLKGSEIQAQLSVVQEDLKKSKELLASVEKEKARVFEELRDAKRLAEEANEKLGEALVAQKRAEENSEIEKFRADELEQAGIEAASKREEEWQKELEAVRNQHAVDVAALLSTTHELQRVKQELTMTADAKNQALSHADDATKIAEIHAEKVEILSHEIGRLKALLDSKMEMEAKESLELVKKLTSEVDILKEELDKARIVEEKLVEKELLIEQLRIEVESSKKAASDAGNLVAKLENKAEELEIQVEEATQLERSASESLDSLMKQLDGQSGLLHDAESEVSSLREKVESLEISIGRQRGDLEESKKRLETAKDEALETANIIENLKAELETVKEEKIQAVDNEKLAAMSVQSLLEEKNKLISELEASRDEEEKSKKAMESLASALHEVTSEARTSKEKLLSNEAELKNADIQIEDLKLILKSTNEKYEDMLEEARRETDLLTDTIEQFELEIENSKNEWDRKELILLSSVKRSEEETVSVRVERGNLVSLLKEAEEKAQIAKEGETLLQSSLKKTESELGYLKGVAEEAKSESMKLKERILDKENELQSITQENEELRVREAIALEKAAELAKLLEEATEKKNAEENGELSDSEKDYDLLPKVVEFTEENGDEGELEKPKFEFPSQHFEEHQKDYDLLPKVVESTEENGDGRELEKPKFEFPSQHLEEHQEDKDLLKDLAVPVMTKVENGNGNPKEDENKEEDDTVKVEVKMWENCKIGEKDYLPEKEPEPQSFEEELESKGDGENLDQINGLSSSETMDINGGSSPLKQEQQKKKKPLLRKFGSLLKKKGSSNTK